MTVADVLEHSIDEAVDLFANHPEAPTLLSLKSEGLVTSRRDNQLPL